MAWTNPTSYTSGEVVTAAKLNSDVYFNLRFLKGLDGAISLDNHLQLGTNELRVQSTDRGLRGSGVHSGFELFSAAGAAHRVTTYLGPSGTYASATTVIADGAGDVTQEIAFQCWGRLGGGVQGTNGGVLIVPGSMSALALNAGADVLLISVSAGGAVTVQRTAGSSTWTFYLLLLWR
jgi:hypothetical protein